MNAKEEKHVNTKIVQKIKKLLALSESSNVYEAELSMLKAQELLAKHKLSIKEVKGYKISASDIKEKKSNISFTKAKWKAHLANLIADNFGCYYYFKTSGTHNITFFGREEDIEICNIVLEYAIDSINSTVKRLRYLNIRDGYSTKGIENDYAIGFINGLKKKFEEQKSANQEWGLVLVKDEEVTEAYKEINFRRTINTSITFKGNSKAYDKGYEDGGKFSISDKIAEPEEDKKILCLA